MKDKQIDMKVRIERPPNVVFAAWTTADALATWFAPMAEKKPDVTMDFVVGGEYSIVMPLPDGSVHTTKGEYREIVANERIVMTWQCDAFPDPPSLVEVNFKSSGSGTEIHLLHHAFENQDTCDNHRGGWQFCLDGLLKYVHGK